MKKITRFTLLFVVGFAAAVAFLKATTLVQGMFASKRVHTVAFHPVEAHAANVRASDAVTPGRILARGSVFRSTLDLVISGDWLLTLQMDNRLTGVNIRTGAVRDFSSVLRGQQQDVQYSFMWRDQVRSEIFVGNIDHALARISVTPEGIPNGILHLTRSEDLAYSIPIDGKWFSNGYFRDGNTTLVTGHLDGDKLISDRSISQPVLPGLRPFVFLEANTNSLAVRGDGHKLVQAFWYAPYIYIYDDKGLLLHTVGARTDISQSFGEGMVNGDIRMRHLPGTRFCYIDVVASGDRIVALFSGKEERESPRNIQGKQLDIFDWDGKFIDEIHIDSSVSRIEENRAGNLIWGVRRGSDPAIIEYTIPAVAQ